MIRPSPQDWPEEGEGACGCLLKGRQYCKSHRTAVSAKIDRQKSAKAGPTFEGEAVNAVLTYIMAFCSCLRIQNYFFYNTQHSELFKQLPSLGGWCTTCPKSFGVVFIIKYLYWATLTISNFQKFWDFYSTFVDHWSASCGSIALPTLLLPRARAFRRPLVGAPYTYTNRQTPDRDSVWTAPPALQSSFPAHRWRCKTDMCHVHFVKHQIVM